MRQFGAFQARTHFFELLKAVVNGEKLIITKNGERVAMLVPYVHSEKEIDPIEDAIQSLKRLRKGLKLGKKLSIRQMLEKGRRGVNHGSGSRK